jgi:hypothetical protein
MPSPRNTWVPVSLGLQGASTAAREGTAGMSGVIKQITAGTAVLPTAGTLALAKVAGSVSTNVLKETNEDLAALTAGVAKNLTLAEANETLRVKATDILKATWTVTTAGSFVGGSCVVWIEPDNT